MKRRKLLAAALGGLLMVFMVLAADMLVVKIQSTQLRKSPQFFAQTIAALKAGDKVERVSESGGWIQVKTGSGAIGWVHSSAVETPKFILLAMNKDMKTQASASEVALAGKGFSKEVEDSYKAKHAEVSFVWVDRMLQVKIGLAQIEDFLKKGNLGDFRSGQ